MISEQAKQRMRDLAARYPVSRSALLPALHIAQQEEGYITSEGLQTVAEVLNLTVDDVKSVVSFYTMYYQKPQGKKIIKVCNSISCYLRKCDTLIEHLQDRLGIKPGEMTPDGEYTLMTVECLASCSTAPVLQVNEELVENVTCERADELLAELERELDTSKSSSPQIPHSAARLS
jgi:NADH-quinone oxidoreductase E subunit